MFDMLGLGKNKDKAVDSDASVLDEPIMTKNVAVECAPSAKFKDWVVEKYDRFRVRENTNIHERSRLNHAITRVFATSGRAIATSYGPTGLNTILEDTPRPKVTKDGLTILEAIRFKQPIETAIHSMICDISRNLVRNVGDGSTSAVLIAGVLNQLLNGEFKEELDRPKEFFDGLEKFRSLVEVITREFLTLQCPEDYTERYNVLRQIAGISNNNDMRLGDKVAEVMAALTPESSVTIEIDPIDQPGLRPVIKPGMHTSFQPINQVFVGDKPDITLTNVGIITTHNFFTPHWEELQRIVKENDKYKAFIVVSGDFDSQTMTDLVQYHFTSGMNGTPIIPLRVNGIQTTNGFTEFMDAACVFGTNVNISTDHPEKMKDFIGSAQEVIISPRNTSFISCKGADSPEHAERVQGVQKEIDSLPSNALVQRALLRTRLSRLLGMHATLYVGGYTESEKVNAKYLVEDSVEACRSAMRYGYTLGGNLTPLYAIEIIRGLLVKGKPEVVESNYKALEKVGVVMNHYSPAFLFKYSTILSEVYSELFTLGYELAGKNEMYDDPKSDVLVDILTNLPTFDVHYAVLEEGKRITWVVGEATEVEEDVSEYFMGILNLATTCTQKLDVTPAIPEPVSDHLLSSTAIIAPVATDIEIMKAAFSIVGLLHTSAQYMNKMIYIED